MKSITGILCSASLFAGMLLTQGCSDRDVQKTESRTEEAARNTGATVDAAATTASVKSKLAADVRLSTLTSINVDTVGNTVTLSGNVPTEEDKQMAERVARTVDGVASVNNNLMVKPDK